MQVGAPAAARSIGSCCSRRRSIFQRQPSARISAIAVWKNGDATDTLNVFHYGYGRMMPVHYESLRGRARATTRCRRALDIPIQIFQGSRDVAVEPETVERWAAARPNVELHLLDDDHQLIASLDTVWERMAGFLRLPNPGT